MRFDFLICSERSGSNLIAKILNAHPEVCGPFPSHLLRNGCENYHRYGDLQDDASWRVFLEDIVFYMERIFAEWETTVTVEHLEKAVPARTLAEVNRAIYELEAEAHGKDRVFQKENHTYRYVTYIATHYPEAKFVWVVRDPRDMALTWKKLASGGVQRGAPQWQEDQEGTIRVHAWLRDIGKIKMVRFEGILTSPEATAQDVCGFLDLDYTPAMLDFHKQDIVIRNAGRIVSWQDLQRPIQPENIGIYRSELSEAEVRYIEAVCREEMEVLGYDLDYEVDRSVDELAAELPPVRNREQTEAEKEAYSRFREGARRLQSRKCW